MRRREILEAAVTVMSRRDLAEVRLADVAREAGTTPGLVIYYFGSKYRMLTEGLAFAQSRFHSKMLAALDAEAGAGTRLLRLLELSCCAGPLASPQFRQEWWEDWVLWLKVYGLAVNNPEVAEQRLALERRWHQTLAEVVQAGQASGEFAPVDPVAFTLRLSAFLDGLAIQAVMREQLITSEQMLDACLRMVHLELGTDLGRSAADAPPRADAGPAAPG
ncbi:MAG TPA: TetR/AcrR family transcriptional regulator [Candidatus Dormibacteraeota bacterium]|nr:TetR/AcrR family transcriptional regulator [Candidatus Dormibacteraeota bacterium]